MRSQGWLFLAGLASLVLAGNSTDGSCGPQNGFGVCHKKVHCCRYGWCGNGGEYCAQGCNPLFSYDIQSCYPLPVCQSKTYTFGTNGNARLVKKEKYKKVDPFNVDFIIDTGELENTADGVILTLRADKVGAKITSTRAMHYGKITFEIQTAWSGGLVTAAVLMGDTSEEVDVEFTGNELKVVQSNIFYDYVASGEKHQLDSDSSTSFANYSLDWTQEKVAWGYSMNSQERILRTVTAQQKHIPALPMYAQMSIWPGGASKSAGTRGWAGGKINWQDQRFKESNNEFRFIVKSVTIDCYDEHTANQAYKYIRNKKTDGQLSFEVVKLKGYGVSKRAIHGLKLQDVSLQDLDQIPNNDIEQGQGQEQEGGEVPVPSKLRETSSVTDNGMGIVDNAVYDSKGNNGEASISETSWSATQSSWTTTTSWSESETSWTSSGKITSY